VWGSEVLLWCSALIWSSSSGKTSAQALIWSIFAQICSELAGAYI
jgi:hypothetical protein